MSSLAIKVVFPKALYPASKTVVGAGNPYSKHTCCLALPAVNIRTQGDRQKKKVTKDIAMFSTILLLKASAFPNKLASCTPPSRGRICVTHIKRASLSLSSCLEHLEHSGFHSMLAVISGSCSHLWKYVVGAQGKDDRSTRKLYLCDRLNQCTGAVKNSLAPVIK